MMKYQQPTLHYFPRRVRHTPFRQNGRTDALRSNIAGDAHE
jgi:hypothetical protein